MKMPIPKIDLERDYSGDEISSRWSVTSIGDELPERFGRRGSAAFHAKVVEYIIQFIKSGEIEGSYKPAKWSYDLTIKGQWLKKIEDGFLENEEKIFDADREDYPYELDIAIIAWRAVAMHGQGEGNTPKQRLEDWIKRNYKNLSSEQIGRIATVCNWDKGRGRKNNKE